MSSLLAFKDYKRIKNIKNIYYEENPKIKNDDFKKWRKLDILKFIFNLLLICFNINFKKSVYLLKNH